jgi:hypothetical protein
MIGYYNLDSLDIYSHSESDDLFDYGIGYNRKDYDENTTNLALSYLENVSSPFFLYINYQATHYPYSYPEDYSYYPDNISSIFTTYFNIDEIDFNASLNKYDNSLMYGDMNVGKNLRLS